MRGEEPPPRPVLLVADRVRTLDEAQPTARAVLVDRGRVAWVGDEEEAAPATAPPPRRVELDGAWLQPAFIDAHAHLTATGLSLSGLELAECRSVDDCLAAASAVVDVTPGGIVWGSGWDEFRWQERRPPLAEELQRAAGGRPVFLGRADGHSSVVDAAVHHHEAAQALDESDAVACAVRGGRHAAHQDDAGRIRPGQRADLAAFTPDRRCVLTVVGGRIVHGAAA